MSYRVECAVSGRAGCKQMECKTANIKIEKGDLRFGTWVTIEERGSWAWRHWGCVTGKVLENVRKAIANPKNPGEYLWDMLDGYDSGDKGSLDNHPDLQEKVRRVIMQGFIDPEDFNGDPEMNKLGEAGLRTKANKKKAKEDKLAQIAATQELESKLAVAEAERADLATRGDSSAKQVEKLVAGLKRELKAYEDEKKPITIKRVKDEDDEKVEEPPKKKRATKAKGVKKAEQDGDNSFANVPAPKKTAAAKKRAVKKEEADSDAELSAIIAPKKTAVAKRGTVKKRESDSDVDISTITTLKKRPSRAKKTTVKYEASSDDDEKLPAAPAPKKRASRAKKVIEEVAAHDDDKKIEDSVNEQTLKQEEEIEAKPKGRRSRKKAVA